MTSTLFHICYTSVTLRLIGTMCNKNKPICRESSRPFCYPSCPLGSHLRKEEQCSVP